MRRLLTAIIAMLYLAVSSGFTVHEHYCMGRLVGSDLMPPVKDVHQCSSCGMEKRSGDDNGCCKDKHKIVKIETKSTEGKVFSFSLSAVAALPPQQHSYYIPSIQALPRQALPAVMPHGPPPPDIPIYLQIRNLRV